MTERVRVNLRVPGTSPMSELMALVRSVEAAGFDGVGIPLEIPDAVWKVYPDLSHAEDWEAAIAATAFVPDEVVAQLSDALGLIGTPEHCAERIVEMTKLGVQNLYLMPLQTFTPPESEVRAFGSVVFPRLRALGLH